MINLSKTSTVTIDPDYIFFKSICTLAALTLKIPIAPFLGIGAGPLISLNTGMSIPVVLPPF